MTLANMLPEKLNEWRPAGRESLAASDGVWDLALTADRCDELGCLVWELVLRRHGPGPDTLQTWAERIAGRTVGLVEPLKVLEVDLERNEALLRSDGPTARGEQLFYYELLLRGTSGAELRRYKASHNLGQHREQVAFALTHEVLAKLVGTVTGA